MGGTSGSGSYGVLAKFKASVINAYLAEKGIRDICKYLANYPNFKVKEVIPQKHPGISSADFIILERIELDI